MMLKTEHIEAICWLAQDDDLVGVELNDEAAAPCFAAITALRSELHRRKHGPFTLAEAVASGKPFRRRAWAPGRVALRIENEAVGLGDGYILHGVRFVVPYGGLSDEVVTVDDITVCDYELMPEGGE